MKDLQSARTVTLQTVAQHAQAARTARILAATEARAAKAAACLAAELDILTFEELRRLLALISSAEHQRTIELIWGEPPYTGAARAEQRYRMRSCA